jgi:HEAT repeat protein
MRLHLIMAIMAILAFGWIAPGARTQDSSAADLLGTFELALEGKKDLPVPVLYQYQKKLAALGAAATPDLIRAIERSKRWEVRFLAVTALEKTGDPGAIEALIHALRDRTVLQHSFNGWGCPRSAKYGIRHRAAEALKAIGRPALAELTAIAQDPRHPDHANAVYALRVIATPRARKVLLSIAGDRKEPDEVRAEAVWGLAGGDETHVAALASLLADPAMRKVVAEALKKEGKKDSIDALIPTVRLAEEDPETARAAAEIIRGICKARRLKKWKPDRADDHVDCLLLARASRSIVYDVKGPALPRLAHWAASRNRPMCLAAIKALGLFRKPSYRRDIDAGQVLLDLIEHPDKDVRLAVVNAMQEKRDYRIMEPLIYMMETDAVNQKRYHALLKNWTREDFGLDVDSWLAWWSENQSTFHR